MSTPMSGNHQGSKRAAELEDASPRSIKRRNMEPTSTLCEDCRSLKLDAIFEEASQEFQDAREGKLQRPVNLAKNSDGTFFYIDALFFHSFKDRLSRGTSCPLCNFFRTMRIRPGLYQHYKLLAFPSSESWMWRADVLRDSPAWEDLKDTVFLAVVPDHEMLPLTGHVDQWMMKDVPRTGVIYRLEADEERNPDGDILARPKELRSEANVALAKEWLDACRAYHGSACGGRGKHEPVTRGFRLIDCTADPPKVQTQPWGTKYAALSYVWGTSDADREDWSKTVLDAVAVTKEMGLQYIWVDRLCINQADNNEKAYLISRMTTIYEEAELTIVAAAGSGAGHGLPGVRSTLRSRQPKYVLDSGSTLLSSLRDPRYDILESDYWTRGWTYQEGVLSNRRLVFTQSQIYWECRNMAAQESMAIPLLHQPSDGEDSDEAVMADFMITGVFKGDAYSGGFMSDRRENLIMEDNEYRIDYGFPRYLEATTHAQLRGLNEHIRAYSKRRLTHDSDALPAFMGITGMYKRSSDLLLLQGLPLWLGKIAGVHSGAHITFGFTVSAWHHRTGQHSMFVSESCRRRPHLPSWSWAGWTGAAVSWRALPNNEHCAQMADFVELPFQQHAIDLERRRLLWAADVFLHSPGQRADALRLQDPLSGNRLRLDHEERTLIGLNNPLILKYFTRKHQADKEWTAEQDGTSSTIHMTIYIFRGQPWDAWNYRHVLLYFTSPDVPDFYETVHTQRPEEEEVEDESGAVARAPETVDWTHDQVHGKYHWFEERAYLNHVHAGSVVVPRGQEMAPVNVVAAVPVRNRPFDWNCQHFVCEGLQEFVEWDLFAGVL
ncbi:HET-domain-containing protein [Parathielavia hyrcaniae]|uniref:HET-domain-containing protein n=1 Tax=Parathielavia hyrcaniae TaxID=113614 RepID=A0AAN6T378_9PEZI|nr:HET-domain-containing protein [Parathielavia hyrcaniae]